MAQVFEPDQALAIQAIGCRKVSLFSNEVSQIGKRASDSPAVVEFAKGCEALLEQRPRGRQIALFTRDLALMVKNPADTCAVIQCAEDRQTLLVQSTCLYVAPLRFYNVARLLRED